MSTHLLTCFSPFDRLGWKTPKIPDHSALSLGYILNSNQIILHLYVSQAKYFIDFASAFSSHMTLCPCLPGIFIFLGNANLMERFCDRIWIQLSNRRIKAWTPDFISWFYQMGPQSLAMALSQSDHQWVTGMSASVCAELWSAQLSRSLLGNMRFWGNAALGGLQCKAIDVQMHQCKH